MFMFQLKHRMSWFFLRRKLRLITSPDQFKAYLSEAKPREFLWYQERSPAKGVEFQALVSGLNLDLKGKAVLEVGPGYGDSLDICHEQGAKAVEFIEIDPLFYTHNRLKGFTRGYELNHMTGLRRIPSQRYQFIWLKGAISADSFVALEGLGIRRFTLSHWLAELERLASPSCRVLICPHWSNDGKSRKLRDLQHNPFSDSMFQSGYQALDIEGVCSEPDYPMIFSKETLPPVNITASELDER